MNILHRICVFVVFASAFASCSEKPAGGESVADDSSISISLSGLTFLSDGSLSDGGTPSVRVTSSGQWRLIGRDNWCHPSATSGVDGDIVTFAADENLSGALRTEEFSFVCGSRTEKLIVVQRQNDIIELFKSEFSVDRTGGQVTVRVSANGPVEFEVPASCASWIIPSSAAPTVSPSSVSPSSDNSMSGRAAADLGLNLFTFDIEANDSYSSRAGRILFTCGGTGVPVTISQARRVELRAEQDVYNVTSGQRIEVRVQTNLAYSATLPQNASSWLSMQNDPNAAVEPETLTTRTLVFSVSGQGEMTRAGEISLSALDGSILTSFTIVQTGSSPVIVQIPDANFREALADLSYVVTAGHQGSDCDLTDIGRAATSLDVSGKNIASLEGIENFPNLSTLDCSRNNITRLDLSATKVWCPYSGGSSLHGNPLEEIICSPYMQYLRLENNPSSGIYGLTGSDGTSSTKLRVRGTALNGIYAQNNASLMNLDIYNCPYIVGSYISVGGCAQGGTLTVYHNLSSPPYVPPGSNIEYINEDPGDSF